MTDLKQAIFTQCQQLERLTTLLEKELHLISSRDAEALISLLAEKEAALEAIESVDNQISVLYRDAKSDGGIPKDISEDMDKAQDLVKQCQFRTQINQKAVEQGQLKLEHLRNLLVEMRSKESMTYDKAGKKQGGGLGKGISA